MPSRIYIQPVYLTWMCAFNCCADIHHVSIMIMLWLQLLWTIRFYVTMTAVGYVSGLVCCTIIQFARWTDINGRILRHFNGSWQVSTDSQTMGQQYVTFVRTDFWHSSWFFVTWLWSLSFLADCCWLPRDAGTWTNIDFICINIACKQEETTAVPYGINFYLQNRIVWLLLYVFIFNRIHGGVHCAENLNEHGSHFCKKDKWER